MGAPPAPGLAAFGLPDASVHTAPSKQPRGGRVINVNYCFLLHLKGAIHMEFVKNFPVYNALMFLHILSTCFVVHHSSLYLSQEVSFVFLV